MRFAAFALCLMMAAGVQSKEIPAKDVPQAVTQALASAFPKAKNVEWEKGDEGYEAEFKLGGVEMSVVLDQAGSILEKEIEVKVKDLPAAVTTALSGKYPGVKVKEAEKVEKSGETFYEVELANETEVTLTAEGEIVGEEADEEADDDDDEEDDDD
jgi:hypothetical protein